MDNLDGEVIIEVEGGVITRIMIVERWNTSPSRKPSSMMWRQKRWLKDTPSMKSKRGGE